MTDTTVLVPAISSPAVVKPGWKTTEFYGHAAAYAMTLVLASGVITNVTALNIAGMAAAWLTSLGYTVARSWVKAGV